MQRKLFFIGNFLVLGLFIIALVIDADREWKDYQKEYNRLEVERLSGELEKTTDPELRDGLKKEISGVKSRRPAIKQIMVDDLKRYDRCITCHVGFDPLQNPSLTTPYKEHPYRATEIAAHKAHSISKFGCTACHHGQGLATTVEDAHGFVEHWEEPMLKAPYIQGACLRCHGDYKKIPGTKTARRGKKLIDKLGCVGCHSFKGVGGEVSVDLGDIADKPVSRIDWAYTGLDRHHWNVQNWIELHLTKDPMVLVPGDPAGHNCAKGQHCEPISPSGMPPFSETLSREDAAAITTYLMSLTDHQVPANYHRFAPKEKDPWFSEPVARGEYVFKKYGCAGCHGEDGAKGWRNFNARGPNQKTMADGREPNLTDTMSTFTREELRKKIQDGVSPSAIAKFNPEGPTPPLFMPAWKDKIKGRELNDLITYLLSIGKEDEEEW